MQSIGRTFYSHVPLYFWTIVFSISIGTLLNLYNITLKFAEVFFFLFMFVALLAIICVAILALEIGALAMDGFPTNPLRRIIGRLWSRLRREDRIGNIFHSVVAFSPILVIYAAFKGTITLIHPFSWDLQLSRLDKIIGFGSQPWQILQPLLGVPIITIALSYMYYIWFLALYGCILWQAFSSRNEALRMQFLLALSFSFVVAGCLLATVFSSAGPCYFSHLGLGPNPYAAQLSYLHSIGPTPLLSVIVQNGLWEAFSTGTHQHGVSAMPSMHVTVAVLLGLLGWRNGGRLAAVLPIFAFLITVASVHLAWHYASDSIAGIALAITFWYSAGKLVHIWNTYLLERAAALRKPLPTMPALTKGAS